jgi:hypothetical membrane protein
MRAARRDRTWLIAGTIAGVIGPSAFTAAWIISSLLQRGYALTQVQISGLAAPGARDSWIMTAGFLALGASLIVFGAALRRRLGASGPPGPGPLLIQVAGLLTLALALLRRDHMLLTAGPESWHNRAHNLVSAVLYLLLIAVPLTLAWRLKAEPGWRAIAGPLTIAGLAAAVILVLFVSGAATPWDGTLQRIGVGIPLAGLVVVALVNWRAGMRQDGASVNLDEGGRRRG